LGFAALTENALSILVEDIPLFIKYSNKIKLYIYIYIYKPTITETIRLTERNERSS
jgi:dephospho-CoA kinase